MGAYSPPPLLNSQLEEKIKKKIIDPTLIAMKKLGHPYKGFLYAGLMIKNGEPYLIEYNVRMGDPECQVLMMRLKTDLFEIINSAIINNLDRVKIEWFQESCITIVLCAKGYPSNYVKDKEIKNLSNINHSLNKQIFHGGTYKKNNKIFANGGRVLSITTLSKNLDIAQKESITTLKEINWDDGFFRKDIGWKVIKSKKL